MKKLSFLFLLLLSYFSLQAQDTIRSRKNSINAVWAIGNSSIRSVGKVTNNEDYTFSAETIGILYERTLTRDGAFGFRTGIMESDKKGSYQTDSIHTQIISVSTLDIPLLLTTGHSWGQVISAFAIGPDFIIPLQQQKMSYNKVSNIHAQLFHIALCGNINLSYALGKYNFSGGFYVFGEYSATKVNFRSLMPYISYGFNF